MKLVCLLVVFALLCVNTQTGSAQDLLNDTIVYADTALQLQEFVQLPAEGRSILSMTTQPTDDDRLFVTTTSGRIYAIAEGAENIPQLWFDAANAIKDVTGRRLNLDNGQHGGLRSLAFHPDFATNGKFYTSLLEDRPSDPATHHYLGSSTNGAEINADTVLVEWTFNWERGIVAASSYRELFRVNMPVYDHPIKQIKFNRFAQPGDEDYGLLYITHGDASFQSAIVGGGQNRDDALGKVLRINPLATDDAPYTTPNSPFADDDATLDEIYALGFRNPHNLSFAIDDDGRSRLIVADIGRDNIEEINLVEPGANHGWSAREGTFVHKANGGSINGVAPLPANEAELSYTFPAAQFDHDTPPGVGFAGVAVAGSHVIDNGSQLQGQYVFGDFGNTGRMYSTSFSAMLGAVTLLDPNDPLRDEPSELTQAPLEGRRLELDRDSDPATPPEIFDLFTELLDAPRSDFRFGEGKAQELYISTKRTGMIYLVSNSLPALGDLNGDKSIDAIDIDWELTRIHAGATSHVLDINRDGAVDSADAVMLVEELVGTYFGDTNLDHRVDFADFLAVADHFGQGGSWRTGDFDGDRMVTFPDFLLLADNFGSIAARSQVVPEPSLSSTVLITLLLALVTSKKPRVDLNSLRNAQ